jgi:hypothetical protein
MRRVLMLLAFSATIAIPTEAGAQGRRLVIEETVIEGKVQKPEITIFITRQNLDTDYSLVLRESFIPKIVKSVQNKPF